MPDLAQLSRRQSPYLRRPVRLSQSWTQDSHKPAPGKEGFPTGKGSAIRAFVNSAKTLRVRYSFSTGFHRSSANRLHKSDPNLGFHCVNRIFAGLARRGDPFSQPSGSSAFLADALAGLIRTERSGRDVSCPAPSGSVFLVSRSITTRARFGKRVRSPALRPSRHRRDQKTFSAGPRSFNSKECGSRKLLPPGSNPFLTRGTVESPAKRI